MKAMFDLNGIIGKDLSDIHYVNLKKCGCSELQIREGRAETSVPLMCFWCGLSLHKDQQGWLDPFGLFNIQTDSSVFTLSLLVNHNAQHSVNTTSL